MSRREKEAQRENRLDAALLIAWCVFALFILLH